MPKPKTTMHSKQIQSIASVGISSDKEYWNNRYGKRHGTSGHGSRGRILAFKAHEFNMLQMQTGWQSVTDLGCGDGFLLPLITYGKYAGYDISDVCIEYCKEAYGENKTRRFFSGDIEDFADLFETKYDVALSFDVTFHITNDDDYGKYLGILCSIAKDVLIFGVNENHRIMELWHQGEIPKHVRYRETINDLQNLGMSLIEVIRCPFDARMDSLNPGNTFSRMYLLRK